MNTRKIKVNIADRHYPLTVEAEEEGAIREAGNEINRLIREFEEKYAVSDKQDAIAMVALQMTSKFYLLKQSGNLVSLELDERITRLTEFIDKELKEI